jgi:hypothetical protein
MIRPPRCAARTIPPSGPVSPPGRARRCHPRRRRAFASFVAVGFLVLFVAFSVVLARHAAIALRRERVAQLEDCAAQALHSAQAWAAAHRDALHQSAPTALDITALLPAAATGGAELRRLDEAAPPAPGAPRLIRIECRVELHRGPDSIRRAWTFAIPG